jgi:hypothetical protein
MLRILRIFLLGLTVILIAAPALGQGNKYARERRTRPTPKEAVEVVTAAPIKDVYTIHLILDGTNYNTMRRVIAEGKMPNLKNEIIDKGATFTHAISTFPSTSTSAYQSFLTGLLPGHAGIPHLQRFDRQKKRVVDYLTVGGHDEINGDLINLNALQNPGSANLDNTATIFELLNGYPTLALYSSVRRGASMKEPKKAPLRALWSAYISGRVENVDKLAFRELMKIYGRSIEEVPRYSLVGLYSADITGHYNGTDSLEVEEMLIQFDNFLSDFLYLLEEQGIRQKTYFIISADHGMHDTGKLFEFRQALIDRGFDVKPKNPKEKQYDLYAADRGISSTHVYTRRPDGSFAPLEDADELRNFPLKDGGKLDLIDFILSLEPAELVMVRDGERSVKVYDDEGRSSRIECLLLNATEWCSYTILGRGDPLKLSSKKSRKLLDGRHHSETEWMHATADEYYTDAVIQLGTLFQDGRAGDLFIVPKQSWGLRKVKAATHGSLIKDDMRMPMFMAGPTVPRGTFGAMRIVDVYPLLLKWFGLYVPSANFDGRDPFAGYRPEDSRWRTLAALEKVFSQHPPLLKMIDVNGFMAKEVRPLIKRSNRKALLKLAETEEHNRSMLHRRIREYIEELEQQLSTKKAPEVAPKAYVKDHLAIARRVEKVTKKRKRVMSDIIEALSK